MALDGSKLIFPDGSTKQCFADSIGHDGSTTCVIFQNTGGNSGAPFFIFGNVDNGDGTFTAPTDWQTRPGSSPAPAPAAQ